jgi:hypothetical protein
MFCFQIIIGYAFVMDVRSLNKGILVRNFAAGSSEKLSSKPNTTKKKRKKENQNFNVNLSKQQQFLVWSLK